MIFATPSVPLETVGIHSRSKAKPKEAGGAVFMGTLYDPGERGIYSTTDAQDRYVTVAYAENSTKEDPVVVVQWGQGGTKEHFEKTIHIKDIDPRNASYPEMCALTAHLSHTGQAQTPDPFGGPLPVGETVPNFSQKLDFTKLLKNSIRHHQQYNPGMAAQAMTLLEICKEQIEKLEERKNQQIENIKQDALMRLLDTVGHSRIEA